MLASEFQTSLVLSERQLCVCVCARAGLLHSQASAYALGSRPPLLSQNPRSFLSTVRPRFRVPSFLPPLAVAWPAPWGAVASSGHAHAFDEETLAVVRSVFSLTVTKHVFFTFCS